MMHDRLVLLGTKGGPSLHSPLRMPTSSLLVIGGQTCVVDCGLGVTKSLLQSGVRLTDIDRIYITHLHSDHILELGPLLHTAWTCGLSHPILIFGPVGTNTVLDGFFASLSFDINLRIEDEGRNDLRSLVRVTEFSEGSVNGGVPEVSALRVCHPPVSECYALRFDCDGWRVTFSSDTCKFSPLAEFAHGSDLLVHEAMLASGVDRIVARAPNATRLRQHLFAAHTEVADVAEIALAADVKHLVLHHLIPSDGPGAEDEAWLAEMGDRVRGAVSVGYDGMEFRRDWDEARNSA
ncbi:MAG: MBL fold metallo-hydrolase [Rhodobacteraceae bacterium]|nr:MBL fold metallo-hydrolase [Paracoccaceae bacterium]